MLAIACYGQASIQEKYNKHSYLHIIQQFGKTKMEDRKMTLVTWYWVLCGNLQTYSCHTIVCHFDVRGISFPVEIYWLSHLQHHCHRGYAFPEDSSHKNIPCVLFCRHWSSVSGVWLNSPISYFGTFLFSEISFFFVN